MARFGATDTRRRDVLLPLLAACLLAAGCQVPAARFDARLPHEPHPSCCLCLVRQLAADSALELTCHPVRTTLTLIAEPAKEIWTGCRAGVGTRIVMPLCDDPDPLPDDRTPISTDELEQDLDHLVGEGLKPANIQVLTDGDAAFTALERLIDSAARRIDVLMFQWENDSLGARLASRLAARAGQGVRVRILVDGGGNLIFGQPVHQPAEDVNGVVAELAHRPNVELLRTRNPFGRFDHRKLVAVDGKAAWSGGRNFTHKSFYENRDVSFIVCGPLATGMAQEFDAFWKEQGGTGPGGTDDDEPALPPAPCTELPNAQARLVATGPLKHQIERITYRVVDQARHHIYMENFTFCDHLLVYKLARARRRGVDVRVVLTLSDCIGLLCRVNRVIANRLVRAGVRVYVYPGMTHAKVAVVDGCWAYIGTGNFDPLSLRHNREMGLALGHSPLVGELERDLFLKDFRPEWELREPLPVTGKDYLTEFIAGLCL